MAKKSLSVGVKAAWIMAIAAIFAAMIGAGVLFFHKELPTVSQTSNNSPGAIQAGRDVIIQGNDKEIVEKLNHLQASMDAITKTNGAELLDKFNWGYILFTVSDTKFIPSKLIENPQPFLVNWSYTNYFVEMTKDTLVLHLPEIFLLRNSSLIGGGVAELHREVGARGKIWLDDFVEITVEVVQTSSDGVVMALGARDARFKSPPQQNLQK